MHSGQNTTNQTFQLYVAQEDESKESALVSLKRQRISVNNVVILLPQPNDNNSGIGEGSCVYKAVVRQNSDWVRERDQSIIEVSLLFKPDLNDSSCSSTGLRSYIVHAIGQDIDDLNIMHSQHINTNFNVYSRGLVTENNRVALINLTLNEVDANREYLLYAAESKAAATNQAYSALQSLAGNKFNAVIIYPNLNDGSYIACILQNGAWVRDSNQEIKEVPITHMANAKGLLSKKDANYLRVVNQALMYANITVPNTIKARIKYRNANESIKRTRAQFLAEQMHDVPSKRLNTGVETPDAKSHEQDEDLDQNFEEKTSTPDILPSNSITLACPEHLAIYDDKPAIPGIDQLPQEIQNICLAYTDHRAEDTFHYYPTNLTFFAKYSLRVNYLLVKDHGVDDLAKYGVIRDSLINLINTRPELIDVPLQVADRHDRQINASVIQIAAMTNNFGAVATLATAARLTPKQVAERLYPVLFSKEAKDANEKRKKDILETAKQFVARYITEGGDYTESDEYDAQGFIEFREEFINRKEIITCGYVYDTRILLDILTDCYDESKQFCNHCETCLTMDTIHSIYFGTQGHEDSDRFRKFFWNKVYSALQGAGNAYDFYMLFRNLVSIHEYNDGHMPTIFPWTGNVKEPWCFNIKGDAMRHFISPSSWQVGRQPLWAPLHDLNTFKKTLTAYLDYQERYAEKLCGIDNPKPRRCAVM